jgi:hypothetical protein
VGLVRETAPAWALNRISSRISSLEGEFTTIKTNDYGDSEEELGYITAKNAAARAITIMNELVPIIEDIFERAGLEIQP